MAQEYLPAPSNIRLADLMKEHNISQPELAKELGCSKSTINRFISGAKGTLTHEQVLKIARLFNVSTDFLLGETNIPDRKNYDIAELGLSVEAAKNLYTGRVNTEVVNLLLENARFAELTYRIAQYFDDTFASGIAAQNAMLTTLSTLLRTRVKTPEAAKAAKDISLRRKPVYQGDLDDIEMYFMYKDYQKLQFNQEQIDTQVSVLMSMLFSDLYYSDPIDLGETKEHADELSVLLQVTSYDEIPHFNDIANKLIEISKNVESRPAFSEQTIELFQSFIYNLGKPLSDDIDTLSTSLYESIMSESVEG